jgi:hypothetical protein
MLFPTAKFPTLTSVLSEAGIHAQMYEHAYIYGGCYSNLRRVASSTDILEYDILLCYMLGGTRWRG